MTKSRACPECGTPLRKPKRCSCGWFLVEQFLKPQSDHRCEYQISGRRCPLPGTICSSPYANGPWYCSEHSRVLDDPQLGEAILRDAEKNYHEILRSRQDWRINLFNK